ncbi:MAG TPA: response regulator [Chloroflexota bacterium]|nr:response regulator [Chloroflexota bacterium]
MAVSSQRWSPRRWQGGTVDRCVLVQEVLPKVESWEIQSTLNLPHAKSGPLPANEKRALVADDNQVVRDMIDSVLRRSGYIVDTTGSGADAYMRVLNHPPDLLVIDLNLPAIGGETIIRSLRALKRDARIIAISGMAHWAEAAARGAGADAFLGKPFVGDDLERLLA